MSENRDSNFSFLCGVLVGSLVGASVAILLAPDSGVNTRTAIRGRAGEYKDRLSVLAGEYKERFANITEEYREKLKELSIEMRERRNCAARAAEAEAEISDIIADEDSIENLEIEGIEA